MNLPSASGAPITNEQTESRVPIAPSRASAVCRNCGFDYSVYSAAKYCPECGQDTDRSPPTLREFVQHFFGNYVAVRGSFLQTIWRLISRPGTLTRDYLDGRKRAYMLPLRLYLTVSVLFFLIAGMLVNLSTGRIENETKPDDFKSGSVIRFGDSAKISFDNNTAHCEGVPDWLCERAKKKFATPEVRKMLLMSLPERMLRYWAYAMFALVPIFAALLKLVYVRRGMSYGSHIVVALHLHTFWLLALLLALAHDSIVGIITFVIPIYAVLAMLRVYGGGWIKTVLKACAIAIAYLTVAVFAVAIVAIIALVL